MRRLTELANATITASALFTAIAVLGPHLSSAQMSPTQTPHSDVPAAIAVPADATLVLKAHATGSQIYTCKSGPDGKFIWTLKAPDAQLFDATNPDKMIGHHGAGPSWMLDDGSKVTGKAAAHVDSPDGNSIPWLLVNVTDNDKKGLLAKVTMIQRLHTEGGKAPDIGCDETHKDTETNSSYTADYYFYAPSK